MNYTDNYKLNLPSLSDSADISALNENFSKIDKKLKENETAIGNVDQTYQPTSANSQSGRAVAQAIGEATKTINNSIEKAVNEIDGDIARLDAVNARLEQDTRAKFNIEDFDVGSIDQITGKVLSTPKTHLVSKLLSPRGNYTIKVTGNVVCGAVLYNTDGTLLAYREELVTADGQEHTFPFGYPARVMFTISGDTDIDNSTDKQYIYNNANLYTTAGNMFNNITIDVDNVMSNTSENPVQNKVVKDYVNKFSTYLASANLCDNEWEYGQISSRGGHYGDATNGYRSKNYLPVKGGETIYQNNSTGTSYTIFQYNQDKAIITHGGLNQGEISTEGLLWNRKIVLDANTKYIRIHKAITATSIDLSSVQVNVLYKEDAEKVFNADGSFDYVEPYVYSRDILDEVKANKVSVENTYNANSTNAISGKGVANALSQIEAENTVKEGSTKPVSGGAVYNALQNVEIDVDKYLSDTSTNPVQNKTLKQYIDSEISDAVTSGAISQSGDIRLKPNFANNAEECIDTSKVYVLPDGNIYAYMENGTYPEITIQDNYTTTTDGEVVGRGSGYYWYKNGVTEDYHVPDNGLVTSKQTNYIPVTAGDILQYTGKAGCNVLIGSWYDGGKNFLSPIMVAGTSGNAQSLTVTAPDNAKYVRFFASTYTGNIIDHTNKDSYSLEVKWEYCYVATIPQWAKTGNKFIPADYEEEIQDHEKRITDLENKNVESILKGKKIVYDGDSICAPWGSENGGAYPKIIADLVGGSFDNQAVGGARIVTADGATDKNGNPVTLSHSVVDNVVNLPKDADLYCFECCVNDQFNMVTLGDFDPTEYSEDYLSLNTKEYCGALETIIRYALTNFVGKPICFIIPHKCKNQGDYGNGVTFADFRKKIIGLFEKYAIPYYDAWAESGLNNWDKTQLDNYFIIHGSNTTGDGTHPNTEGYKRYYAPQLISLFERIMPKGIEEESDTPSVEPDTPETPDEPEEPDTPTYTNVLDTVGYTAGYRLNSGGKAVTTEEDRYVTGFIPCKSGDIICLKNITVPETTSGGSSQCACYTSDSEDAFISGASYGMSAYQDAVVENGNVVQFTVSSFSTPVTHIRISAQYIDENSIITVIKK